MGAGVPEGGEGTPADALIRASLAGVTLGGRHADSPTLVPHVKAPGLLMLLAWTALLLLLEVPHYGIVSLAGAIGLFGIITMIVALAELAWPRRLVPPRFAHR